MRSVLLGSLAATMLFGCAHAQPATPDSGNTPVAGANVRLTATMLTVWQSPKPPADAKKKTTAGAGRTAVDTTNPGDSGDSFWVSTVDIDGDGQMETADLLYDDEDKVLYIYASKTFACKGGGSGTGEVLIAVNAEGNPRQRQPGSGWYAVALDAGECNAKQAGIYGCRFNAQGNPTICGIATLDAKNDDLIVTTAD